MVGKKIVNVASVPQRSPFRYPGGKTWLVPEIRSWLCGLQKKPEVFIEPFAGGGIASLTAVFENLADRAVMVEKDEHVAAVWRVIFQDAGWLAERIRKFDMNLESVQKTLSNSPQDLREKAFHTILRNRVQRGGIMAPGASLMKCGENGRGIASRWYPETLAKRILAIHEHHDRFEFIEGDAFDVIHKFLKNPTVAFFIDPPYTAGKKRAGSRLYIHSEIEHKRLFSVMAESLGTFMMTYDDTDEIVKMAATYGFSVCRVPMKTTHHTTMCELLIIPNNNTICQVSL